MTVAQSMIEKAVRAACIAGGDDPNREGQGWIMQSPYAGMVRAVIEAIAPDIIAVCRARQAIYAHKRDTRPIYSDMYTHSVEAMDITIHEICRALGVPSPPEGE